MKPLRSRPLRRRQIISHPAPIVMPAAYAARSIGLNVVPKTSLPGIVARSESIHGA